MAESSLPFGQVALKFFLPWASLRLLFLQFSWQTTFFFMNDLLMIIHIHSLQQKHGEKPTLQITQKITYNNMS